MTTKKKSTKKKEPAMSASREPPPGRDAYNFRFTTVKTEDSAQHLANQNAALRVLATQMAAEIGKLRVDLVMARAATTPYLESSWVKTLEDKEKT